MVGEAFEYRRYQSGVANPFFPNLRFPGQYHDVESDLFENWNRYYDAFSGRYIQPEPLLNSPRWARVQGQWGRLRSTVTTGLRGDQFHRFHRYPVPVGELSS